MNQPSCNLAVVVDSPWSRNVIVGDSVPVVSPSSLIRNCGSNGVAAGIGVALRHGTNERLTKNSPYTMSSGTVDELSQCSSRGSGNVAATNSAVNVVIPLVVSISASTSGAVV